MTLISPVATSQPKNFFPNLLLSLSLFLPCLFVLFSSDAGKIKCHVFANFRHVSYVLHLLQKTLLLDQNYFCITGLYLQGICLCWIWFSTCRPIALLLSFLLSCFKIPRNTLSGLSPHILFYETLMASCVCLHICLSMRQIHKILNYFIKFGMNFVLLDSTPLSYLQCHAVYGKVGNNAERRNFTPTWHKK